MRVHMTPDALKIPGEIISLDSGKIATSGGYMKRIGPSSLITEKEEELTWESNPSSRELRLGDETFLRSVLRYH